MFLTLCSLKCLSQREKKGEEKEEIKRNTKKSLHVGIPFFWRKFDADVSAFGRGMIHLLILWHQTFTSHSLSAKMKASTPDKCTRGLSTLLYFYCVCLWCTLSGLAFYSDARNARRSFKPDGTLRGSRALIVHLYFFLLARPSIVRRLC